MLPSLDNFVSFGSEVIKARPDYKRMLVDIYTTSVNAEQLGENDRVNGSQLAESILLNLRGSIDDVSSITIMASLYELGETFCSTCKLSSTLRSAWRTRLKLVLSA